MNLPDLNNDVLNIISDFIRLDNVKEELFECADR